MRDVLHLLLTKTLEAQVQLASYFLVELRRYMDAASISTRFDPSCYVDPVSIKVIPLNNHITKVQPDPELHPVFLSTRGVARHDVLLKLNCRNNSVHRACELCNNRVTSGGKYSAVVVLNGLVNNGPAGFEILERQVLVLAHLQAKAHHVGCKNGGEFASWRRVRHRGVP